MSISFQLAFDYKMRTFPSYQEKICRILLGLKTLSKSQDATSGELYRAVRAGFEKTMLQKMASQIKGNSRPGVYNAVELVTMPEPSGQTIYVVAGLLNNRSYAARLQQKGMGLLPIRVTEINDADFMRRVLSQPPQTVNAPMADVDESSDSATLLLSQATVVNVGGNDYTRAFQVGGTQPSSSQDIYQN